ncbi:MAG: DinB family protein [Saprospiraceae bacterium]|nr:DinB family protein [Saprospiraceae bacterium]
MQHQQLSSLAQQLMGINGAFQDAFSGLSGEQLNWKPNDATWSIAQNIDHLITINSSYFPLVASLRAGTLRLPWWSRWKWATQWMGNMIYKSVGPDRKRKSRTFPIWEPSKSALTSDILDRFKDHQEAFARFMLECQDLVEQGGVIHSPANSKIVYSLSIAFEIIVQHERRHLEQARELKALLP